MTFKSPSKQPDMWDRILNILIAGVAVYLIADLLLGQDAIRQNVASLFMVKTPTITLPYPQETITPVRKPTWTLSPKDATREVIFSTQGSLRKTKIASQKQTEENIATIDIPATRAVRGINCKPGFKIELGSELLHYSNDQWTLYTCSPTTGNKFTDAETDNLDFGTRYTNVVKTDLTKTWTIVHSSFDYSRINRIDALLQSYRWTADGKFVFLYPTYYPGGDGFKDSFFMGTEIRELYRLNLQAGIFEPVLLYKEFRDFEISPDDHWLIYSEIEHPGALHVRDLDTGSEKQVTLNGKILAAGAFTWTRDSSRVVIFSGYEKTDGEWDEDLSATEINILDMRQLRIKQIIPKDERLLTPCHPYKSDSWYSPKSLCLHSISQDPQYKHKYFSLDLDTGKILNMDTGTP